MAEESDAVRRAQKRIGTVLKGKYTLDRLLGAGGMAAVYAATHRNQKQFAVKMLHAELSVHEDIRARFLREGYAANSVKHPGAVAVMDDDTAEDGAAFLVMELLEGTTVEGWWEQAGQRLDVESVLGIAWQLLDVLAAAHAKAIVHRDIKPANLFVTRAGELKVLDFGIARVRAIAASDQGATGTGVLLGTPAFMAPEQAIGKTSDIDARTDLWAVGATMFTLLTGRAVHEGETAQLVMVRCATQPARSVTAVLPAIPPAAANVIDRALVFERDRRWPSADAMRDAVRSAFLTLFRKEPTQSALAAKVGTGAPVSARAPVLATQRLIETAPSADALAPEAVTGKTTAQPVSTNRGEAVAPKSPAPRWFAVVAGGVLVIAGASVVGLRALSHRGNETARPAAEAFVAPAPQASASAPVELAPPPSAGEAMQDASPTTSSPTTVAAPTAVPGPKPGRPVTASPAPPTPPPKPSAQPSAKPKPDCNPPYFFDADGNQHFKPECYH